MQTKQELFLDLLGTEDTQFVIPVYQRVYSWGLQQCKGLWQDINRSGRTGNAHFIGTVLYAPDRFAKTAQHQLDVIDGQQRMTTLTIVIAALVKYLRAHGATADGLTADDISGMFLHVKTGDGAAAKLILSLNDCPTLEAVVNATPMPERPSERITENLDYFYGEMEKSDFDADVLWAGMKVLTVIDAELDRGDNPQLIFESLNARGVPLTTADLVRNYLLLAETHTQQTYLYDTYWSIIESLFVPDPGSLRLDNAIQGWLSVRFRKVRAHGPGEVYSIFKRYVEDDYTGTTEDLLRELRNFCFVWAENYRYHAVKKFRTMDWAVNGAPTLTSGFTRQKAHDEAYAQRVRAEMRNTDATL